ncbi:pentatricopeptide repeat-containing protein, chloroplastic [Iris pallida]|uniref:Pentatricopeptide repeat-containing protein, chloroplastic n=1 Tax=Iris pallida TaxID=29817 RepID=A0AAX6I6C6_IRIPA|nr:pentatricopeptide repeat-containing protein, chloroplastic [Iris pallida]
MDKQKMDTQMFGMRKNVWLFERLKINSIVESDPEVLCAPRGQCSVGGRFCDYIVNYCILLFTTPFVIFVWQCFLKVAERTKNT